MRAATLVAASATIAAVTQTIGIAVWLSTAIVSLERFDLSATQSPEHNPAGFLIPWAGTLVSMLLLLALGVRMRPHAPIAAGTLVTSMLLFVGNSLFSVVWSELWEVHALMARVSFITLIVAQILFVHNEGAAWERTVAYVCMLAAVGLFVLPKYAGIDAVFLTTAVRSTLILGIAEVLYLAIIYATLYRVARRSELATS